MYACMHTQTKTHAHAHTNTHTHTHSPVGCQKDWEISALHVTLYTSYHRSDMPPIQFVSTGTAHHLLPQITNTTTSATTAKTTIHVDSSREDTSFPLSGKLP